MRILMTSDRCGGVGRHARTLALELRRRGHEVTLFVPRVFEWMSELAPEALAGAIAEDRRALARLARRHAPDCLHSNHFAFVGALDCPTLLGVHSDVYSWWRHMRDARPPENRFHAWYRALVEGALARAQRVAAPSRQVLDDLAASYGFQGGATIPNGAAWVTDVAAGAKRPCAVSVARWRDPAKQLDLLLRSTLAWPLRLIGEWPEPRPEPRPNVKHLGPRTSRQVARALLGSAVYVAASRYEPFGLAPLEAAHSGCALLLNDIPSFRAIWGPHAVYFKRNDAADLSQQLAALAAAPDRRGHYQRAARRHARLNYTSEGMAVAYESVYRGLT
jgi:glycosyltransferase involved in cell wall biosynthesis